MTKSEFISAIAYAVAIYADSYDIKVHSPIIAQAILESNWGESKLSAKYYNYFGLKCGSKWTGKSVNLSTNEEYTEGTITAIRDSFRVYDSLEDGVRGYFEFIQLKRYQNLKGITDPRLYLEMIKADGYTTTSSYVDTNIRIIEKYDLTQYDLQKDGDNMTVIFGSARIDENGKASGGSAGDQTGKEVSTQNYYMSSKGWYCLRPKSDSVAVKIATAMKEACANNNIGYDQNQRNGALTQLKKYGSLAKISVKTETDCSALVRACIYQATKKDVGDIYTGNLASALENSGLFEKRFSVTSSNQLYTGDVLVTKTKGHTVVVVSGKSRTTTTTTKKANTVTNTSTSSTSSTSGSSAPSKTKKWTGCVIATSLNVRSGAGTNFSKVSFSPLANGTVVDVCDTVVGSDNYKWYYIKYNGKYGFVSAKYVSEKVNPTSNNFKTTSDLNLRKGAGINYGIVCVIPKDTTVQGKGDYIIVGSAKWIQVVYGLKTGYVNSKYLTR